MPIDISQFIPPKSNLQKFLDSYQYFLSIAATFLFCSEIIDYAATTAVLPIDPLVWMGLFGVLSLPFVKKIRTMPKPLVIAMTIYMTVSLLSLMFVVADEPAIMDFRKKILSVFFVCLMYIIYAQKSLTQVKYTILLVVLVSVVNNFIELLNPGIFSELNVGRPAGFYINPNKTGAALMLGMIFSINAIKKPFRWMLVLLVIVGLLLTFTRGAILGWLIVVPILIGNRMITDKIRNAILPVIFLIVALIVVNPLATMSSYFGGEDGANWNVLNRLDQFQNPSLEDESSKDRQNVAKGAWRLFGERPFAGNGLGTTNHWTVAPVSTHNMYLYYMVDHGIIGLIFLPGAIFAVVYNNKGEQKVILVCFAIFVSLWGIFSHNVLEERYILANFSLLAALNTNQQWYRTRLGGENFQRALAPARAKFLLPSPRRQRALPPADYRKIYPPSRESGIGNRE